MRDLHIDLGGLFGRLDQAEGLVQILARAVDAVLRPDDESRRAHFFRRRNADLIRAAEHPRQDVDAVGEDDDAFGAHLPERTHKRALVERMHIGHRKQVCRGPDLDFFKILHFPKNKKRCTRLCTAFA